MKNGFYNYDNRFVWDSKTWDSRFSCISPLVRWIQTESHEKFRGRETGACRRDYKETDYFAQTFSTMYPELLKEWEVKGLKYSSSRLGVIRWIGIFPKAIAEKGMRDTKVLLVTNGDVDYSDEGWAMDVLEYYRPYLEWAAKENAALLFEATDGMDPDDEFVNVLNECASINHIDMNEVYLDISVVHELGKTLKDIPNFQLHDKEGNPIEDPDAVVKRIGPDIPVIDISGIWMMTRSFVYNLMTREENSNAKYSLHDFIHSPIGREMSDGVKFEYDFTNINDPKIPEFWDKKGLDFKLHRTKGEQWITLVPKNALEKDAEKLPCVMIMHEVSAANPYQAVIAMSYYWGYADIAAQGDCMLIYFALETPDDNELYAEILDEATDIYPIDRTRVYITGHSHNCRYSVEYMRRHWRDLAGIASLGTEPGFGDPKYVGRTYSDELINDMSTFDMPIINITGFNEHACFFPIHSDALDLTELERTKLKNRLQEFEIRADAWQRRLKACRCPMKTIEEIAATKYSKDYVERQTGIPSDKTECLYWGGFENYISDIKNIDGNYHLRIVALGNMPHIVTPITTNLSWSYLRRFARNLETGEVIELY